MSVLLQIAQEVEESRRTVRSLGAETPVAVPLLPVAVRVRAAPQHPQQSLRGDPVVTPVRVVDAVAASVAVELVTRRELVRRE